MMREFQVNFVIPTYRLRGVGVAFRAREPGWYLDLLLRGRVGIAPPDSAARAAFLRAGQCLGEVSALTGTAHTATAPALTRLELAGLNKRDIDELIALWPDIGLLIVRNPAAGRAEKLMRSGVPRLLPRPGTCTTVAGAGPSRL
jgi:CRP-like cAMP-binding protein